MRGWTLALLLVAFPAQAAEVTGLSAQRSEPGRGREVFLRLEPGETATAGEVIAIGKRPDRLEIVEVVGQRARARLPQGTLRPGEVVPLPRKPPAQPAPQPTPWQIQAEPPPPDPLAAQAWTLLAQAPRPLRVDRPGGVRTSGTTVRGDVTLVGVGVLAPTTGEAWGLARLSSRLDVQGLAGTALGWRHDLALALDDLGGMPGSSPRRRFLVRQLELALQTTPQRRWGGSAGRTLVAEGAGSTAIDGAMARFRPTAELELHAFGGLAPSPISTAPDLEAPRVGAGATLDLPNGKGWARLAWSTGRTAGGQEPHLLGLSAHLGEGRHGRAWAELELAAGQPDLQGTGWQARQDAAVVRPLRGLLSWEAPELAGWRAQFRYTYQDLEPTRALALALRDTPWGPARTHGLWLAAEGTAGGWRIEPAAWGRLTQTNDPYESGGFGGGVRVARPFGTDGRWLTHLATWLQHGGTLTQASLGGGTELAVRPDLRVHGRLRLGGGWLQTTAVPALDLEGRLGADWALRAWSLGLTVGSQRTWDLDGGLGTAWLDATLVLSRRL